MRLTLHSVRCFAKTESDEDEIYCLVTIGSERRELARMDVGNFEIGAEIRPDKLIWEGKTGQGVTFTLMENDANEPGRGSDDFIGEITMSADGNCTPGRATLDEGFAENNRYRQFSMTGSAAHYVVQLRVEA